MERSTLSPLASDPVDCCWAVIRIQGRKFPTQATFAEEDQPSLLGGTLWRKRCWPWTRWDKDLSRWRLLDFSQDPADLQAEEHIMVRKYEVQTREVKPENGV